MLSDYDKNRYDRQIRLPELGVSGQQALQEARVLIVGMGGLGCPAAQYLAGMGIGTIGLLDYDRVTLSNLNRQLLYTEEDIGHLKVEAARDRLLNLNPHIQIHTYAEALVLSSAGRLFGQYDVILDCTDNLQSKYLINDVCVGENKPWVSASVHRFQGQLSVFNFRGGPTYRCLFPDQPPSAANCEETGVLGVIPAVMGLLQAMEAAKIILGQGSVLSGRLKIIDLLSMKDEEIGFPRNEDQVALAREKWNAGKVRIEESSESSGDYYLDVRDDQEEPKLIRSSLLRIPYRELEERHREIPRDHPVWVYCQTGQRSKKAVEMLSRKFGFANLKNIEGGIFSILNEG